MNAKTILYILNKLNKKIFIIPDYSLSNSGSKFKLWNCDLSNHNDSKIYAYYCDDGGIYKTMHQTLYGNCDASIQKLIDIGMNNTYYSFVRIDNYVGYCQFTFHSLKELIICHFTTRHSHYPIYEFDNQREFFKWCLVHEKLI